MGRNKCDIWLCDCHIFHLSFLFSPYIFLKGWTKPNAFHVCITSYKLVLQDHQAFRRKSWRYLILDEAQNIKNFKSQRWQSLLNFNRSVVIEKRWNTEYSILFSICCIPKIHKITSPCNRGPSHSGDRRLGNKTRMSI